MTVPFLDLKAQYESIGNEITDAIQQVMDRTAFAGGPFVEQFEKEFADFCQCRHAIGVGSGTEALWLTLLALGIGQNDEVITVPNTFIATAEAISFCNATPVLADVDKKTYTMDPELFEAAITPRTKAVIPVHLFGQMADMDPIMDIAKAHGLFVIEDACQAQGAKYKGKLAGSVGDAGCFSFYPGKNLGACGEAGAVTTNNPKLADKIRILRDHGQSKKYHHRMIGWNARMDGIQGAILSVKLKHLTEWNNERRTNAKIYNELMGGISDVILPKEAAYNRHVYHIYGIRVQNRDTLMSALAEKDVYCGIHYPVPIHLTEAYQSLGYGEGDFPVAEKYAKELLSLPMFPELKREQLEKVTYEISQLV
ncbi:DegT/DnrJ/EryC1/StrS family aminotransferase [Desulfonema magnum]|uniref:DegT/DnrJ/EryC1/StrS aminotransferase domain-containing protein n=1 Tax=Desulfonema magnum TaxID=45655 RepID=A0A975BQX5_9BACT|nr:DegT/DnrJ/EryC1/StrS family aminotransferase [Desulfonema magnum]QTA90006.1 DegT/DnrJ/EryC1/StrS aminotransferase domain-containing protein [Desulfonema magnum]